jgi:hypothetical protein
LRKLHDTCTVPDCSRAHKARGYCGTHYAQYFRGAEITDQIKVRVSEKPPACTEADCDQPVKAKGLCKTHYARFLRHGHTKYRDRKKAPKPCSIPDCENWLYAGGLCHPHYTKTLKWKDYGLDAHGYVAMLEAQKGVCAICGRPERRVDGNSRKTKDLAVDHCHATNRVRALLCSNCNTAIGLLDDNPDLLSKARAYLLHYADISGENPAR